MTQVRLLVIVLAVATGFFWAVKPAAGDIVINELMYHPASDERGEEYLELYNTGPTAVDLNNYAFTEGIAFTFVGSLIIEPDGYVVVAADAERIRALYGIENVVGNYIGQLSNAGETIVLEDSLGRTADELTYLDEAPWPVLADGEGPSMERIAPDQETSQPGNWKSSPTPLPGEPWGSPGQPNAPVNLEEPPEILDARHRPQTPTVDEVVYLRTTVLDEAGVDDVWAEYWIEPVGTSEDAYAMPVREWMTLDLVDDGRFGDREAGDASYESALPSFPSGTLVRYRFWAEDLQGNRRRVPAEDDAPSYQAYFVRLPGAENERPRFRIVVDESNFERLQNNAQLSPADPTYTQTRRGDFVDDSGAVFADVPMRLGGTPEERRLPKPGWAIFFHDGERPQGIDQYQLDALTHPPDVQRRGDAGLFEQLAWAIYSRAGLPTARTQPVLLELNGADVGLYLRRDVLDDDFLRRYGLNREGNLYLSQGNPNAYPFVRGDESLLETPEDYRKAYRNTVDAQSTHADLITFIGQLNTRQGEALQSFIEARLDVDRMIGYLAAGALLADRDRVWRRHALYREPLAGVWQVFPVRPSRVMMDAQAPLYLNMAGFPRVETPWPLASHLMQFSEYEARYRNRVLDLMNQWLAPSQWEAWIDEYMALWKSAVELDRTLWEPALPGYQALEKHAADALRFMHSRRQALLEQLGGAEIAAVVHADPPVAEAGETVTIGWDGAVRGGLQAVELVVLTPDGNGGFAQETFAMNERVREMAAESVPLGYEAVVGPFSSSGQVEYYFELHRAGGDTLRYPTEENLRLDVVERADFHRADLVINEIMYHSGVDTNEWVEFHNRGDVGIDLAGWVLSDENPDHRYVFEAGDFLPPAGYLVVAQDAPVVRYLYGVNNVQEGISFNWGNGGDAVRLFGPQGLLWDEVVYLDEAPWPIEADGEGPSLELRDPFADNSGVQNWSVSSADAPQGTPGQRNSLLPPVGVMDWALFE